MSCDYVILEFLSDDEDAGGWIEEEESEEWLASLLPLRADLMNGDLRSLHLGWLSFIQFGLIDGERESDGDESDVDDEEPDFDEDEDEGDYGELDRNAIEPPVPPGLGNLTASLQALAEFLHIDQDLVAVAAERSAEIATSSSGEFNRWLLALPGVEKDALLLQLVEDGNPLLRAELSQRFRQSRPAERPEEETGRQQRRTVGELLKAATEHAEKRKREEARRKAEAGARQAREEAIARAKYLDSITGREEELWLRVEDLVEERQAKPYEQAIQLLKDLWDLAAKSRSVDAFKVRLNRLRERHVMKLGFIKRLGEAKLR